MSTQATPGGQFEYSFYGAPTGLVGTMRWRLEDGQGNAVTGFDWSISGFVESPAGSGSYTLTGTGPLTAGTYTLVVNDGTTPDPTNTLNEDLVVGGLAAPVAGVYTTIAAVRQVLSPDGSTSATLGTAASLSDDEIQEAIAEGAAEIDARLTARYSVPFDPVPAIIEKINRDLAAYMATLTYRRNTPLPDSDPVALRYARALALLTGAQKGDIQLVGEDGDVGQAAEAYVVNTLGYEGSLFTLEDFSLAQAPFRGLGIMPGGPFDGEGF